jgi:hypothetical protein
VIIVLKTLLFFTLCTGGLALAHIWLSAMDYLIEKFKGDSFESDNA